MQIWLAVSKTVKTAVNTEQSIFEAGFLLDQVVEIFVVFQQVSNLQLLQWLVTERLSC